MAEYSFSERMIMSEGVQASCDVGTILMGEIPGALSVMKAHTTNDRSGTDYWVEHHGRHLSVDVKSREQDCKNYGKDDLALETFSVVEKNVIGWTRDESKRTDYVLWLWQDTGRWCLVPFLLLCKVFQEHWEEWVRMYPTDRQFTHEHGGYHSECVFVPRRLVWREIYLRFS